MGADPKLSEPMTFQWVKSKIESQNITSIDTLISVLPQSYRENFVLMRNSQSSQGATPERPRVLMFGNGDRAVISFNGSPEERGFNKVEMVEFKNDTNRFEFREIDFTDGLPKFSEANPPRCLKCHQEKEPRPNWPEYPDWPGAFGKDDDIPRREEIEQLQSFMANQPQLERYRHLITQNEFGIGPFALISKGEARHRPNMRFTKLLARLQAKTLLRRMKSSPHFKLYRDLILLRTSGGQYKGPKDIASFPYQPFIQYIDLANPLRHIQREAMEAFAGLLKEVQIKPVDLSLEFDPKGEKIKASDNYNEGSSGMVGLLLGELWRDLIAENRSFVPYYKPLTGYKGYEWIDELGMPTKSGLHYGDRPDPILLDALSKQIEKTQRELKEQLQQHGSCKAAVE